MDKLSQVTVGGVTLLLNNLTLVQQGEEVVSEDTDSLTIDFQGKRYTIKENEISFRVKKKGVFGPKILVKSLADLDQSEEEKMKINYGKGQLEVPAAVEKVLRANRVTKEIVELGDFDKVLTDKKLSAADKKTLEAFDTKISEAAKVEVTTEATAEGTKVEVDTPTAEVTVETKPEAPTNTDPFAGQPTTPTSPVSPLEGSNVFGGGPTRKTEAEIEAARREREIERRKLAEKLKQGDTQIEAVREERSKISNSDEAVDALRRILTIDNYIPLFRTLVTSDTRLKATIKDTVKAADRKYHPTLADDKRYTKKGSEIELRLSDASYKLNLVEAVPSQPRGYFIYVPKALQLVELSKLNLPSNRVAVIKADEAIAAGHDADRVIRYFSKAEIIQIMILLKVDMRVWSKELNQFEIDSPRIFIYTTIDSQTGAAKFSLRAVTATNEGTKLSIRKFIPLSTHDIATVNDSDFDPVKTTRALFGRLLLERLDHVNVRKLDQLRPDSAQLFTENPDGSVVFNQFQNRFEVPAYESTTRNPLTTTVPLPKVIEKTTVSNGNVRVVFSRSSHTDTGSYNPAYIADLEAVGAEINKNRHVSAKSQEKTQRQVLALEQASLDILKGQEVNFR